MYLSFKYVPLLQYMSLLSFLLFLAVYSPSWILCSPSLLFASSLSCRVIADRTTDVQYVGLALSLSEGHLACWAERDSRRENTEMEGEMDRGIKVEILRKDLLPLSLCPLLSITAFHLPSSPSLCLSPSPLSGLSIALISNTDSKTERRKTLCDILAGEKKRGRED